MDSNPNPPNPSPNEETPSGAKPSLTEEAKRIGWPLALFGAAVGAAVATFKGAINSPEFKEISEELGEIFALAPQVIKDELTADSGFLAQHRQVFEEFEQRQRQRTEQERQFFRGWRHLLYPVYLFAPAPLWAFIRRRIAPQAPQRNRGPLRTFFGTTGAFVIRVLGLIKAEIVFAYISLLAVEVLKWVGTILFAIWRHMAVFDAWHEAAATQTVGKLIGLWTFGALVPIFFFWLLLSFLHYAFWLRMFPNAAIIGGFFGFFLKGSRPKPNQQTRRGLVASVGAGIGNAVFTWSIKGQNEGKWYSVCSLLLMFVPFFMLWHPAFLYAGGVAVMILWQISAGRGNNQTAEDHRVVEQDKTYKALAPDPDNPGQLKLVTGHKFALPWSHEVVNTVCLGLIGLMVVYSWANFFITVGRLGAQEARQQAVTKLTDQDVSVFTKDWDRRQRLLKAEAAVVVQQIAARETLEVERTRAANVEAPDSSVARLREFNREKAAKLQKFDEQLKAMLESPTLRAQLDSLESQFAVLDSSKLEVVRDSIFAANADAITALDVVKIGSKAEKLSARERHDQHHQEWVRAVKDSLRWKADSLKIREAQAQISGTGPPNSGSSKGSSEYGPVNVDWHNFWARVRHAGMRREMQTVVGLIVLVAVVLLVASGFAHMFSSWWALVGAIAIALIVGGLLAALGMPAAMIAVVLGVAIGFGLFGAYQRRQSTAN